MGIVLEPDVLEKIEALADSEKRTPSEIVADALELYSSQRLQKPKQKKMSGIEFLYAIAGLGASNEHDVSERDEEILASEVDPIRGWHVDNRDRKYEAEQE
jgi:hypothetical protein